MNYTIRRATIEDYTAIERLFAYGDEVHHRYLPDRFRVVHPARDKEFIGEWVADPQAVTLLALKDEQVVGVVQAAIVNTVERSVMPSRIIVNVESLVVDPDHQRQGIGAALMEEVHRWARAAGVTHLELSVYEFNTAALRLYERFGYRTVFRKMQRDLE
jgi:GNAT superfamily N-acetyltransferase